MMRSASSSRWCGLTVHFAVEQPPTASAIRIATIERLLEVDTESPRFFRDALVVVGVEDPVVARVAAQREPLLERDDQAAADVHHRAVVLVVGRVLVGLGAAEGPAGADGREG